MNKSIIVRRIIADSIDWVLIFVVGAAFLFVGPNFDPIFLLYPSIEMFSVYGVLLSLFMFQIFPFLKDVIFRNASLGKLLMGLRIVDEFTYKKAKLSKVIFRNLTFYIFFVEFFFLLIKGKTLADMLTKTTVCTRKAVKR